jgi:hypothetical protein
MFVFSWIEFAILLSAATLGIVCVMPYLLELNRVALKRTQERMHQPMWMIALLQGVQSFALTGVATGLGLLIAHHIGLEAPLLEGLLAGRQVTAQIRAIITSALLLGIASSTVLLILEVTVFWPRLPQATRTSFPIPALWKRFLASFYGGINEELLCRLFLLSLLALVISMAWHGASGRPTLGALWLANVIAAAAFGLSHLPTTASLVNLSPLLIGRAILLNGIVGVATGYLFWQYGLEAAMLAHFIADLVLHVIGDSIAKGYVQQRSQSRSKLST